VAYAAMTGRDPADADSLKQPPLDEDALVAALAATDVAGVRIGVDRAWIADADAALAARFWEIVRALEAKGAVVVDIGLAPAEHERWRICHAVCIADEVAAFLAEHPQTFPHLSAAGRIGFLVGRGLSSRVRERAKRHRVAAARRFAALFDDVDVIVTPSTGATAARIEPDLFPHGELNVAHLQALIRFTSHGNLIGNPSMTVPIGFHAGLPIGFLVHGRDFDESGVIRVCAVVEDIAHRAVPAERRAFAVPLFPDPIHSR
jgi:Asp-tRNA(Asn)/Glu-tRNA(Gln) amidotransferase A subunit family amidase